MSLKRLLYSLFLYLIFPIVIGRLYWRGRSNPAYRKRIFERLGFVKIASKKPVIWIHAVSVGETNAAQPLINSLISNYSNHCVLVTTTTPTGSERVVNLFSDRVEHVYFPYDLPEIIFRFLGRIKPEILIVVETEIWPNLYASCGKRNIPIVLVNARLSETSTNAYLKIKGLIKETLFNVTKLAVRSEADALSFKKLGAIDSQIKIAGNIKFDFKVDQQQVEKGLLWKQQWGEHRPVLVAASTHEGEDERILNVYKALLHKFSDLLLVLVPRHPERFDGVFQLCQTLENETDGFKVMRHSHVQNQVQSQAHSYTNKNIDIILGDSMGEMQSWFASADVVFIGGSLVNTGGHNPLEAIAQGKPVASGQYMFNFRDIVPELLTSGLLSVCETDKQLEKKLSELFLLDKSKVSMKANKLMQQHQGATARLLDIIDESI